MSDDWSPTFTCQVQKKYRIWIPKTIRMLMKIDEGDYVEVKIRAVRKEGILRK
jgi:AbrB family looped-hinge helix DNA binding protein